MNSFFYSTIGKAFAGVAPPPGLLQAFSSVNSYGGGGGLPNMTLNEFEVKFPAPLYEGGNSIVFALVSLVATAGTGSAITTVTCINGDAGMWEIADINYFYAGYNCYVLLKGTDVPSGQQNFKFSFDGGTGWDSYAVAAYEFYDYIFGSLYDVGPVWDGTQGGPGNTAPLSTELGGFVCSFVVSYGSHNNTSINPADIDGLETIPPNDVYVKFFDNVSRPNVAWVTGGLYEQIKEGETHDFDAVWPNFFTDGLGVSIDIIPNTYIETLPTEDLLDLMFAWFPMSKPRLITTGLGIVNRIIDRKGNNDFIPAGIGVSNGIGLNIAGERRMLAYSGSNTMNASWLNKNLNFLHNGSDWCVSFLLCKDDTTGGFYIINTTANANGNVGCHIYCFPQWWFGINVTISSEAGALGDVFDIMLENINNRVNLVVLNYEALAVSNNLTAYVNGAAATVNSGSRTRKGPAYSALTSTANPNMWGGFGAAGNDRIGHMIIHDHFLDSDRLDDLHALYAQHGTFPLTL